MPRASYPQIALALAVSPSGEVMVASHYVAKAQDRPPWAPHTGISPAPPALSDALGKPVLLGWCAAGPQAHAGALLPSLTLLLHRQAVALPHPKAAQTLARYMAAWRHPAFTPDAPQAA